MLVAFLRLVILLALALTALFSQVHGTGAQGANVTKENRDVSDCIEQHGFLVCTESSIHRHQIVTPDGGVITGFTVTSCVTITSFGEFVSQECQKEHNMGLTVDGFLTIVHDSGRMEFTSNGQTCAGRFLLQIVNGEIIVDESTIECN